MQFVRNSYYQNQIPEPWDSEGVLKHIERIGRLCYRSDDLIEEGSAAGFIDRLKKRKHWAMLEHYIFTLSIPALVYDSIMDRNQMTIENVEYIEKLRYIHITKWPDAKDPDLWYLVSGSATAFNYLWACDNVKNNPKHGIAQICQYLRSFIPELMHDPLMRAPSDDPDYWKGLFDARISCLSRDMVRKLPKNLRLMHDWMSVHFVVERSSTHDLVRHRPPSYAQESTRYCNYDKKGMCFIIPCQFTEHDKRVLENENAVKEMMLNIDEDNNIYDLAEDTWEWFKLLVEEHFRYGDFIKQYNWSPQEAKSVIAHCLRAEINITAFKGEWTHIFNMRADKAAFPQIQEVMVPLLRDAIEEDPEVYSHLKNKLKEGAKWLLN